MFYLAKTILFQTKAPSGHKRWVYILGGPEYLALGQFFRCTDIAERDLAVAFSFYF